MDIKVNLDEMLYQRRVTLTELSERVGISLTNLSVLKNGRSKGIRFNTLSSICEALDCTPGDILGLDRGDADRPDD